MNKGVITLILFIVIIGFFALFFSFYYTPKCTDPKCWDEKLKSCSRAKYINEPVDASWEYTIKGKDGDNCMVNVKLLEIKRGLKESEIMKGKEMTCLVPLGFRVSPESDINKCTGRLKEEMQTLIIKRLHEYILHNIGQISSEFTGIQGITSPENLTNQTKNNVTST
ncbi:MAG: hypothetical protein QXI33_03730 [Candidatus Pacearchaeota archaeon]